MERVTVVKKKKLTKEQKAAKAKYYRNKFTVSKGLKIGALAGPAAHQLSQAWVTGDWEAAMYDIPQVYTGFDLRDGSFDYTRLIRGYGGTINHIGEKKLFRFLGISGPRTAMKTIGDALDYITYFGMTAMDAYNNRDAPVNEQIRLAYRTQYGVDLEVAGTEAYQPWEMLSKKLGPYILQRYIRKGLRMGGIRLGKMVGM